MSVNRIRKNQITIRLTEEEFDVLKQRMRDKGFQNREAYLREMALTGYILRLDLSEVHDNLRLLANAASGINQVAKRVNETRGVYASDVIQLRQEVSNARTQVSKMMKVFGKINKFFELVPADKRPSRVKKIKAMD